MADRIEGSVHIVETTGLPEGLEPPAMSITALDASPPCSEEDRRPGRGGLHDVERIRAAEMPSRAGAEQAEPFTLPPEQTEHLRRLQAEAADLVQGLDPAAGHAWRITAEHVGAHGLAHTSEDGGLQILNHRFAQWVAQPWVLTVQAWSLRQAFAVAAERGLNPEDAPWMGADEDDREVWQARLDRFRLLTQQHIDRLQRLLDDLAAADVKS